MGGAVRAYARAAEEDVEPSSLRDILRSYISQPELPTDVDYVRVMSLHKSKGLTADLVVVSGCVDGLVPTVDTTKPQNEQDEELREQRRVFYVAITRPTRVLVLSSSTQLPADLAFRMRARVARYVSKDRIRTIASPFLQELGDTAPDPIPGPLP
jgi:DNA helicase-2/ATP-dependent DNA helicase PcrA